jgi:hydrogenase nickel incorporation protein HypA/HybF
MSYCEGVLEAVVRRARGRRVACVGVRIGAVHRVMPSAFAQSFQLAAAGGPAEGAASEITILPVHGHCMDCRHDFHSPDPTPACPSCGSLDVAADGGDEVVLEWIQYVDPAAAAGEAGTADDRAELVPPHTHSAVPAGGP